jgi:hypothetical protein
MLNRRAGRSAKVSPQSNGKYLEHQHYETALQVYQTLQMSSLGKFTHSLIDGLYKDVSAALYHLKRLPEEDFKEFMEVIQGLGLVRNELRHARFLFDVEEINPVHRLVMRNRAVLGGKQVLHRVIVSWPQSLIPAKENVMARETTPSAFEYDIAVSFAREDKAVAEELISLLAAKDLRVFHDEYTGSDLWGKDVLDHLVNLYARKACYCVLLISGHYPLKTWTQAERSSATERALREAKEYILPVRLDDTDMPGMVDAEGALDLREHSVEKIASLLEGKLAQTKPQSGPPARSHDLRSGNVPRQDDE